MTAIQNPILNSPFEEPSRHFRFDEHGITPEIAQGRRESLSFIPVPPPKKKGPQQLLLELEERVEKNDLVNRIRERVGAWRQAGYPGPLARISRTLLEHWISREENRLFFAQIEALETVIYLTEIAPHDGAHWIDNRLRIASEDCNPGLLRTAFKMATGTGKTVVMAMLIAWHTLNRVEADRSNHQAGKRLFSNRFLLVTPGITIRDRLRVLLPADPGNYYDLRDIVPAGLREDLNRATIVITNYHAFRQRERSGASGLTRQVLHSGGASPFTESPAQMVRRVCRELISGRGQQIAVINDEAHHCYRRRSEPEAVKLTREERHDADRREQAARLWDAGLVAVQQRLGLKAVYDLSATPFFLRGSGWSEGTLFPWVVSDYSLIEAIEGGIVKVPRVPVEDDSMVGDLPTYRDLWIRIRDHLPRKGRGTTAIGGKPELPPELEAALHSLYENYRRAYERWESSLASGGLQLTPPVFIVVCSNTNVSKIVYDYIAGWEKQVDEARTVLVAGQLPLFSNVADGRWSRRPVTILIDSQQLESGEAMGREFKQAARIEIEDFKQEYRARYPGRDVERLSDEDLLREVMNTVGKPGKLGEHVRCVVSVSMLTEGWDANTVTHILGVRAFGTQLLCEQVVGRALRRISYVPGDDDRFTPEYAEVYGIPFSFIPASGATADPPPLQPPTRVRAVPERSALEIRFPRVQGYRYELPHERLAASFSSASRLKLSPQLVPTWTESAPIVGESARHSLDELRQKRMRDVEYLLARTVLETYYRDDAGGEAAGTGSSGGGVKAWLFPQVLNETASR